MSVGLNGSRELRVHLARPKLGIRGADYAPLNIRDKGPAAEKGQSDTGNAGPVVATHAPREAARVLRGRSSGGAHIDY